ncbi:MAG: hypothetical protein ACRDIA_07925, partial [Actinomycetota bacterium]
RELQRQHDMRRIFDLMDLQDLQRLISSLGRRRLKSKVEARGDIDFASRMAWAFLRHPLLLVKYGRIPRFPMAWLSRGAGF